MLLTSQFADREVHVVVASDLSSGDDWLDRPRAVVATLDTVRPAAASMVIDLHSDRWVAIPDDGWGGSGPRVPSRYDLAEQQSWAEEDLRALQLLRRTGRWPDAVVVDVSDETQWNLARTYATASLGVHVYDHYDRLLATIEDAGAVITAALTPQDVIRLRRALHPASSDATSAKPVATVRVLDEPTRQRSNGLLEQQATLRDEGRPRWLAEQERYDSFQARSAREDSFTSFGVVAGDRPPAHPADDYTVDVLVTTHPLPARPPASISVQLRTARLGPLRTHDHQERIYGGVFAISLHALSPGLWPEGQELLPCQLHATSTRVTGTHAVVVADVPSRPLPGTGRPPLHDGWGMWMPWAGWSIWIEQPGEDTLVLTAPVSWTYDPAVTGQPQAQDTNPKPDAIAEVTLTFRRR
ncbi:hypothetical protein GTR02_03910 [Kineococcus sp. R8]|uniref:hypothetical protein n=1 Tax=Kineococcus siccus TaxID=2696567 RepID=UPI001412EB98|nr:hypothetical protein [Kineococcus siccus]NAZ80959.1 hypothetical protein [Kineococcus siccus]